MGARQERKERRKKAEEEVGQAFVDSLEEIGNKIEKWTFVTLYRKVEAKVSEDTKKRFPDMIKYEILRLIHYLKDKHLVKEREGGHLG